MSDYHVAYVRCAPGDDRAAVTERMRQECTAAGKEGWRLVAAVADLAEGTTKGVWLYFAEEPRDAMRGAAAVDAAAEIIERTA